MGRQIAAANGKVVAPSIQGEDRVTVAAEPEEDGLAEAQDPDIAPEEAHAEGEQGEHER